MSDLSLQRCFNHGAREAVARCPRCTLFYCRECVTQHDHRLLCASCIRKEVAPARDPHRRFAWTTRLGGFLMGVGFLVCLFYFLGRVLLSLPDDFHEGTIWQARWWEEL